MSKRFLFTLALATTLPISTAVAQSQNDNMNQDGCSRLPTVDQLKSYLKAAPTSGVGSVGGLFKGAREYGAVINRAGELCAEATSTDDTTQVWPASQAIGRSKAFTANAFSVDGMPYSTARLYTLTQPGQSLWGVGQVDYTGIPFLPPSTATPIGTPRAKVAPTMVFVGGGLPLYSGGKVIGALGVSGDTSCADHEIAKRIRTLAGLNPPDGEKADDISYSSSDGMTPYTHPVCVDTFRNGEPIGGGGGGKTGGTTVPPY